MPIIALVIFGGLLFASKLKSDDLNRNQQRINRLKAIRLEAESNAKNIGLYDKQLGQMLTEIYTDNLPGMND